MGTIDYMSPEQVLGQPADPRSDLFSLGVVLYEMATRARPFPGDSMGAVFDAILHKAPTAPVRLNPRIPIELERIVNRCLEKDAAKRWASAGEVRDVLTRCLAEVNTGGVRAAARRWVRSPWMWAAAGLVIALTAAGAVAYARHRAGVRWAREDALPKIRALIEAGSVNSSVNYLAAYRLAEQAERSLAADPTLQELLRQISTKPTLLTEPSGASVWVKPYLEREARWQHLGETPIRDVRLPRVQMRWRVEKPGFASILRVGSPGKPTRKRALRPADVPAEARAPRIPACRHGAGRRDGRRARVPRGPTGGDEPAVQGVRRRRRLQGSALLEARVHQRRACASLGGSDAGFR